MYRYPRSRSAWLSLLVVVPLLLITTAPAMAGAGLSAGRSTARAQGAPSLPGCGRSPLLVSQAFPTTPRVDNPFLPLVSGTQYTMQGSVGGASHRVVTTVTDLTKVIDGVSAIVLLDVDLNGTQIQESEIFFEAQDEFGTVWNLGEYPEEYSNGKLTGAPSTWIAGVAHAKAGFSMLAQPRVGTRGYSQGRSPRVGFDDCAKVFSTGQRTCVPAQCYDNVLVTDEWAPNDPQGGHQRKFYAPGVGGVRVEPVGGVQPEVLKLSAVARLCAGALAKVREDALDQDSRGYRISPDVFGTTAHAQPTLAAGGC